MTNIRSLPDIVCNACGVSFRPRSRATKCCSKSCAVKSQWKQGVLSAEKLRAISYKRMMRTNGGRRIAGEGYVYVYAPDHPEAVGGMIAEHRLIAERALGRRLPPGVEVHHVNHIRTDNRPSNLVICPNRAYHALLHKRERALDRGRQ